VGDQARLGAAIVGVAHAASTAFGIRAAPR